MAPPICPITRSFLVFKSMASNPHLRRFRCQRRSGSLKKLPVITRWVEPKPWRIHGLPHLEQRYTTTSMLQRAVGSQGESISRWKSALVELPVQRESLKRSNWYGEIHNLNFMGSCLLRTFETHPKHDWVSSHRKLCRLEGSWTLPQWFWNKDIVCCKHVKNHVLRFL